MIDADVGDACLLFEALSENGKPRILSPPQILTEVTFEEVIVNYINQDNSCQN